MRKELAELTGTEERTIGIQNPVEKRHDVSLEKHSYTATEH